MCVYVTGRARDSGWAKLGIKLFRGPPHFFLLHYAYANGLCAEAQLFFLKTSGEMVGVGAW